MTNATTRMRMVIRIAIAAPVHHFLHEADLIFGIGCSFTKTNFGTDMPAGKAIIHATLDPLDLNKDVACQMALIGDANWDVILAEPKAKLHLYGKKEPRIGRKMGHFTVTAASADAALEAARSLKAKL